VVCYRFLRKLLREESFDRCHAVMTVPAGVNAWLVRKRIPYHVSLQGSDVPGYNKRLGIDYKLAAGLFRRIWTAASAVPALKTYQRRNVKTT